MLFTAVTGATGEDDGVVVVNGVIVDVMVSIVTVSVTVELVYVGREDEGEEGGAVELLFTDAVTGKMGDDDGPVLRGTDVEEISYVRLACEKEYENDGLPEGMNDEVGAVTGPETVLLLLLLEEGTKPVPVGPTTTKLLLCGPYGTIG